MFPSRSKSPKGKRPLLLPPRALLEPTRREESTNQSIMQDQNSQTQKRPRSQNIDPSKLTKLKIQFSRYRIYFDGVPAAKVRLLKPEIEKAGAVQDAYITDNPEFHDNKSMMQNSPDIVSICQQLLDIPLFSLAKLELFLDSIKTIQPEVEPPKKTLPGGLESALRREKIFGLSTTNSAVNRKSFTGYYALVEELSGSYQPIVCLDYEKDGKSDKINWPMLRLKNHSAYSVFAPRTSDPGLPQSSSGEHDHGENEIALMNSNASGIPSVATGSFASTTSRKGLPDIPSLQKLNHKIVKPAIPAKRIRDTETQDDDFSSIKDKAGFCENCKEKYKNYHEHIETKKHRKYASHSANFAMLDKFLQKMGPDRIIQIKEEFNGSLLGAHKSLIGQIEPKPKFAHVVQTESPKPPTKSKLPMIKTPMNVASGRKALLDTHVIPQKPRLEDEKLVKESPQILKKKIKLHLSSEQTGSPGVSTQLRKEANPLPTNDQSMTPSKNPFESFLTKKLKAAPNNDSLDAKESTESSKDNEVVQSTDNEDVDSKSESRKTNKEDEVNSGSSKDEVEEKVDTEMDCDGSKEDLEDSSINTNVLDAHETGNGKEEESPNDQIVDDKLLAENDLQDKASIKDQVPINMRGKVESEKLETTENVLANFESKLDSVEKPGDENLETQIPSGEVVSLEQLPSILDCHVLLPAKQLSKDHDKKTKHCIQNGNFESGLVESKMDAELTKGIENVDAKLEVVVIDSKVGITKRIEAANENDISESPKCEELADSNESGDEKEHFEIANNDAQKKEELAAKELDITNNENDKEILVSKNPVILIGTNAAKAESPESDQLDQMDICEPCDFEYAMESSELLNESRKEPRNHTPAKDNTMSCSNYVVQPLADISRGPDVDFSGVMSEFITSLATTPMSKQILGKKSSSPMSQTSESGKPKIIRKSSTPNSQSIIRTRSRSVREASTPIPLQKIRKIKITGTESESELAKVTSTAQHQLNETPTRNSSAVNQTSPTPIQFSSNEVYNNPSKDISSTQNENEIKSSPIPLTITRIQGPSSKPEHPPIDTVASTQNMAKIKASKRRKATPIQIPSNSDKPPFKPIVSTQIKGKSNEPKKKKATPIQVPSNKVDTRFIGTVEVLSRSANPSIDTVETGEDGTLAIAPIGSFSPHGSLTRRKALQDYCIPSRLTYTDSSEANVDENQANGERLDGLRNQLLESPLAKQKQQSDIMSRRVTLAVLPTSSNNSKQSPIGNSKSLISKHPTATSFAAPLPEQLSATISSDNIVSKQRRHSSFKGSYLLP